jgi:hypothetical protein
MESTPKWSCEDDLLTRRSPRCSFSLASTMSRGGRRRGNPHPCTGNSSRATDRRLIQWQPHITDREVAKGQSGGTRAANLEGAQQGVTE